MKDSELSNSRTNKELENELRNLLIKKKEINLNLRRINKNFNKYYHFPYKFF